MPDSELVKQLKKKLPGIPTIMFNSDEDFALKSIHYPDPIDSTVKALGDMALSHESNDCRKCGKAASLVCSACRGLPTGDHDGKMNIRFCSADCQKESWKTHKIDCKAAKHRALLYRSASLSKSLFYIHQRTSFAWGYFDNIEKHGPVRVVHLQQPKSQTRKSMLVPFSTVTDLVSDPLEQEAFLTHLSCAGAIINSGPMLAGMIKGNALLCNSTSPLRTQELTFYRYHKLYRRNHTHPQESPNRNPSRTCRRWSTRRTERRLEPRRLPSHAEEQRAVCR